MAEKERYSRLVGEFEQKLVKAKADLVSLTKVFETVEKKMREAEKMTIFFDDLKVSDPRFAPTDEYYQINKIRADAVREGLTNPPNDKRADVVAFGYSYHF